MMHPLTRWSVTHRMASTVNANVFDIMAQLDDVKSSIPENLYLNISNLLKEEYTRQSTTSNTINQITYNIQNLTINNNNIPEPVPVSQPVTESVPEPVRELWRVRDLSHKWGDIIERLQDEDELEGSDYDTVEVSMHTAIDEYVCDCSDNDLKYFIRQFGGIASAIEEYNSVYGLPCLTEGDTKLYQQLVYSIIQADLTIELIDEE